MRFKPKTKLRILVLLTQELMPPEAEGERFLELSQHGEERELRERLDAIRRARAREE